MTCDELIEQAARLLHTLQWMGEQEDAEAAWDHYPVTSVVRNDYLSTAEALFNAGLLASPPTGDERDALAAKIEQVRETIGLPDHDRENPFSYDPWDDDSVDPRNLDEVVSVAVSRGWDAGSQAKASEVRAVLDQTKDGEHE